MDLRINTFLPNIKLGETSVFIEDFTSGHLINQFVINLLPDKNEVYIRLNMPQEEKKTLISQNIDKLKKYIEDFANNLLDDYDSELWSFFNSVQKDVEDSDDHPNYSNSRITDFKFGYAVKMGTIDLKVFNYAGLINSKNIGKYFFGTNTFSDHRIFIPIKTNYFDIKNFDTKIVQDFSYRKTETADKIIKMGQMQPKDKLTSKGKELEDLYDNL
jgi:hypothetical protein